MRALTPSGPSAEGPGGRGRHSHPRRSHPRPQRHGRCRAPQRNDGRASRFRLHPILLEHSRWFARIISTPARRASAVWPIRARSGCGCRENAIRVALAITARFVSVVRSLVSVMSPDPDPHALRELRRFLASSDAGGGGSDETESRVKEGDDDPTMDSGGSTSAGGGSRTRGVRVGRRDSVDSEHDERHPQAGERPPPASSGRSARLLKREVHRHRRIHA